MYQATVLLSLATYVALFTSGARSSAIRTLNGDAHTDDTIHAMLTISEIDANELNSTLSLHEEDNNNTNNETLPIETPPTKLSLATTTAANFHHCVQHVTVETTTTTDKWSHPTNAMHFLGQPQRTGFVGALVDMLDRHVHWTTESSLDRTFCAEGPRLSTFGLRQSPLHLIGAQTGGTNCGSDVRQYKSCEHVLNCTGLYMSMLIANMIRSAEAECARYSVTQYHRLDSQCTAGLVVTALPSADSEECCRAACTRAFMKNGTCVAFAFSFERAPYCELYNQRSCAFGGLCPRLATVDDWNLYEMTATPPKCTDSSLAALSSVVMQCTHYKIVLTREHNTIVNCGNAYELLEQRHSNTQGECVSACIRDPRCLMFTFDEIFAIGRCTGYPYNRHYDYWLDNGSARCYQCQTSGVTAGQPVPSTRLLIGDKLCAQHIDDYIPEHSPTPG